MSSISVKIWHVKEYSYQLLPEEEYGHFFSSEGKLNNSTKKCGLLGCDLRDQTFEPR